MSEPRKPTSPADDLVALAKSRGGKVLGVEAPKPKGRPSKYRNVRCEWNGFKFDSKAEMAYAQKLEAAKLAGMILDWQPQPAFRLGLAENKYVADFLVFCTDGAVNAVDVKGTKTAKFQRDVKLWKRFGPCDLIVIKGGKVAEKIEGKRKQRTAS